MREKDTDTFYFQIDNKGGVLFPVLTILFMFSLLLIFVAEDYFSRREILVNTKDYYLARTIEELSLLEIDKKESNKTVHYNIGETAWIWNSTEKNYSVETSLSNQYKRTSNREITTKR